MRGTAIAASLLLAAAQPALAQGQGPSPRPCLQPAQVDALITFTLPATIEALGKLCVNLPAGSYLRASGPSLAARYRGESKASWPAARSALGALTGQDMPQLLSQDVEQAMLIGLVAGGVASKIKPGDCGAVSETLELLAPLPLDNLSRLTTLLIRLGSKGDKSGPFNICPAPGR